MHIAAGKFKAQCLSLMDHVRDTHEKIVITKRGQPVAQMVGVEPEPVTPLLGRFHGLVQVDGDIISSVWIDG